MARNRSEKDTPLRRYQRAWVIWDTEFRRRGRRDTIKLLKLARETDDLFQELARAQKMAIYGLTPAMKRAQYNAAK